jgi:ABC-type uncharacterized transport system permease subunit
MTEPWDMEPADAQGVEERMARPLRRVFLLSLLPMLGLVLFAVGAGLALRAFGHNNSLSCTLSCSHYSYALPIALGVLGIVVLMAGGAFASYYTARNVGLPLIASLMRRQRQQRL